MSAFGEAINDETLKGMSWYKDKIIRQEDRAREAIRLIQDSGKNIKALNHALDLKADFGDGVSTLCLVYNATGDRVDLVPTLSMDWFGSLYKEEPAKSFENGQWIAFLHAKNLHSLYGSEGARVYRGIIDANVRDFLVSWSVPIGGEPNSAYTKVGPKDGAKPDKDALEMASKISIHEYDAVCKSAVTIGGVTTSECIAVLEHKFTPLE